MAETAATESLLSAIRQEVTTGFKLYFAPAVAVAKVLGAATQRQDDEVIQDASQLESVDR